MLQGVEDSPFGLVPIEVVHNLLSKTIISSRQQRKGFHCVQVTGAFLALPPSPDVVNKVNILGTNSQLWTKRIEGPGMVEQAFNTSVREADADRSLWTAGATH